MTGARTDSIRPTWARARLGARSDRRALAGSLLAGFYSQGALVVTGVITARSLGATDRGYWALLLLVPAVLQQVGTFGLPLAVTFFIATDRSRERRVVRLIRNPAFVQVLLLTAVQAIALWLLVRDEPHDVIAAGIVSLLLIAGSLADIYGKAILQGQGRYTTLNFVRTAGVSASLAGIVVVYALGHADLVPIAAVWVAANLGAGLLTLALALSRRAAPAPPNGVSRREMVRFGLRGFVGTVSPVDTFRLDQAVIGLLLPPRQLGLYVAGLAFTNLPSLIARSIGLIALPQVARERQEGRRPDVWRFFTIALVLVAGVVLVLEITAGWLVPLFFGSDFDEAIPMARILLLGSFFYALRRVLTDTASGAGLPGLGSIAEVVSWAVLLPAVAALVLPYGANGVATAMAVAAAVSFASLVIMIHVAERRTDKVPHIELGVRPYPIGDDE